MPPPRKSDTPEPGFYLIRLTRGGPWVGAQITHDDADGWRAMIDGIWSGPSNDPWLVSGLETIHWYGRASTESEVKYRIGLKRWAEIHAPDAPAANPTKAVNLDKLIPF